jgi:heme-degrading monooxygenase HmoA
VIARQWRAWCTRENADSYEQLLRHSILPELDRVDGCRGAYVLRRETTEGNVEFLIVHLFDSLAIVKAFAGDDYQLAVVPEMARPLLACFEQTATHYEVRAEPINIS